MERVKQEWDVVMGWLDNDWSRNGARNCAVAQMEQDGFEEIGSSDINCVVYDELCMETEDTYFGRIVEWAKELSLL
jgi:hypothetical protein